MYNHTLHTMQVINFKWVTQNVDMGVAIGSDAGPN